LVNYWPFNGDYQDYAGGANVASFTSSGSVTFSADRFNNTDKALRLNLAFLNLPRGYSYVTGSAFSLMGWIYLFDTTPVYMFMLGNGALSDNVYFGATSGYIAGKIISGQSDGFNIKSPSNVTALNTWLHTAFTFDGKNATIYVNGILRATNISNVVPRNVLRNQSYFCSNNWTPLNDLHNLSRIIIYDFRIYNRAVGASEIKTIMNLY
jgi:hypothetical protein